MMRTPKRNALVFVAASALFFASAQGVSAQQPPDPHMPEVPQEQTPPPVADVYEEEQSAVQVRGELVRVDADANTLVVKDVDGVETEFRYNDATEIVGAGEGTAGLATMSGAEVTVHYERTDDATPYTATKIEIAPRS